MMKEKRKCQLLLLFNASKLHNFQKGKMTCSLLHLSSFFNEIPLHVSMSFPFHVKAIFVIRIYLQIQKSMCRGKYEVKEKLGPNCSLTYLVACSKLGTFFSKKVE